MIVIKTLTHKNWATYGSQLQELENLSEYPFGSDFFRIDHGSTYFQFFERLGQPIFNVAIENEKIVACAAGILRKLPLADGEIKSWYLCDLKVHPQFRGRGLPSRLFRTGLFLNYLKCSRGYAISMNPSTGNNGVINIIQKLPWLAFMTAGQLNFFNLSWAQMVDVSASLTRITGPLSYLSLANKKDLIMKSSNQTLNLLHVQYGPLAEPQLLEPQKNFIHMICAQENSPLNQLLVSKFPISAQATLLSHRMNNINWDFILTSDI
ncbi:MAG: GNAT family N-acetyltransferase [Gammaproteobacteria bacterium]|nr:GNAT family N-acetyltransferase [Gammaproteobacteria bacterium]